MCVCVLVPAAFAGILIGVVGFENEGRFAAIHRVGSFHGEGTANVRRGETYVNIANRDSSSHFGGIVFSLTVELGFVEDREGNL